MRNLLAKRLLLVSGKGGVGKSTVAAALARAAHSLGRLTLFAEIDTHPSMPHLLGAPEAVLRAAADAKRPEGEPLPILPGLATVNLRHRECVVFYLREHLPIPRVVRAVVKNPIISRFLRAAPSVSEMAVLNRIYGWARAMEEQQAPYDLLVVDLPALGHAHQLLKAPFIIDQLISVGPAAERTRVLRGFLEDRERTGLVLVSLAEEMPVNETAQFAARFRSEMGLQVQRVFVNQVTEPMVEPASPAEALLDRLTRASNGRDGDLAALLRLSQVQSRRARRSDSMVNRLRELLPEPPLSRVPLLARGERPDLLVSSVAELITAAAGSLP